MDTVEVLLRDELRRLADDPPPDADRVLTRMRHRRRTGRVRRGLVAAAAVALAGGGAVALRPAGPGDPDGPRPAYDLARSTFHFLDARRGFAAVGDCPDKVVDVWCDVWLGSTLDGGRTWRWHPVPGPVYIPQPEGPVLVGKVPPMELRVFDANRIALERRWPQPERRYSADGGRTWAPAPAEATGVIDQIPPGAQATVEPGNRIAVWRPDGTATWLANTPAVPPDLYADEVTIGADGSAWVDGFAEGRMRLFVSRDRGRRWAEVPLPEYPAREHFGGWGPRVIDTYDGRSVYYLVELQGGRGPAWRTDDDGRHWDVLPAPEVPHPGGQYEFSAVVAPDGGLVLVDGLTGRTYTAGPSATRFTELAATPVRHVSRIGARFMGAGSTEQYTTADGRTWTLLRW